MSYRQEAEDRFGDSYWYNGSGTQLMFFCPECQADEEGEPKLYVGIDTGGFTCKVCGIFGYVNVSQEILDNAEMMRRPPMKLEELDPVLVQMGTQAYQYLEGRGVSPEDIAYYGFMVSRNEWYSGGIIAPGRDDEHPGFQIRIYDRAQSDKWSKMHEDARWWSSPGHVRRNSVWNIENIAPNRDIYVAEGCFSAVAIGGNVVHTYGKEITTVQVSRLLALNPKRLIFVLDGGSKEREIAWKWVKWCWDIGREARVVELPERYDPDDVKHKFGAKGLKVILSKMKSFNPIDHMINSLAGFER